MITIVGLGNPGDVYRDTRHNVGWLVLQALMQKHNLLDQVHSRTYNAQICEAEFEGQAVTFFFPLTFMNQSGGAVAKRVGSTDLKNNLIIVHDDIDLPFGTVRIGVDRGAGGHNGVQSIIDALGTKTFARIRVGIGKKNIFGVLRRPNGDALSDFVLGTFSPRELKEIEDTILEKVDVALTLMLRDGIEKAMQTVNAES